MHAHACMEIIAFAKLIRTVNFDEVYIKSENFASKICVLLFEKLTVTSLANQIA